MEGTVLLKNAVHGRSESAFALGLWPWSHGWARHLRVPHISRISPGPECCGSAACSRGDSTSSVSSERVRHHNCQSDCGRHERKALMSRAWKIALLLAVILILAFTVSLAWSAPQTANN